MALRTDTPGIAIQLSRGVLVASIQVDLEEDVLARFREDLLGRIKATGTSGVILDVSGLETVDAEEFAALRLTIAMARLMGAEAIVSGLQPGVASALITSGVEVDGLRAAIDLDAAFAALEGEDGGGAAPDEGELDAAAEALEEPALGPGSEATP
jgi:rsbT antagonist protein RsbS